MATISQANSDQTPVSRAAVPGTTKMPEPIVPPTPRLTSSKSPSDRRQEVISAIVRVLVRVAMQGMSPGLPVFAGDGIHQVLPVGLVASFIIYNIR